MTLMHPSAIWLYLAQFFTRDVLVNCASLEELYSEVDFRFLDLENGTSQRLWNRAVADRVRVLSIGPYFVCDALESSQGRHFRETAQIVRRLLARFRNVEKYHILWHERPTATLRRVKPKYELLSDTLCLASAVLATPFSSARYLRSLTIECSLDKAEHLFLPTVVLPALEEFNLCIRDDHADDLDAAGYIMVHHLARFMNNTHRTLRSFAFETSLKADFSPLFSALGFFAHLSKLALSIPTSDPHLGDPRFSLRGFCTNKSRTQTDDGGWLSRCLTGITFSSLRTLSVGTSFIPLDVVMLCAQQWADTLTDLDILGEYLSYEARLETLKVGVTCLCPELVDMLAESLPGLTKLNLRVQFVASHRREVPRFAKRSLNQTDSQLEGFCAEMSRRKYQGWKLQDIGVWKFAKKLQYQGQLANAVRDSLGH
ncbi:hypothetical protein B0H13DRAFT_2044687 [Mycena leptocephala]|nr:hypothetical protein B0H13DRAFT_2044687 [Mycena leptocephala]